MASELKLPIVLVRDYNHVWSPLESMYWSQSSNSLVSKHPSSVLEEIVSHFCPQCLTRFSEEEYEQYLNCCPSCSSCPSCETLPLVSFQKSPQEVILVCNWCLWRSDDYGIVGEVKPDVDSNIRRKERNGQTKETFTMVRKAYQNQEQQEYMQMRITDISAARGKLAPRQFRWSLNDLEAKLDTAYAPKTGSSNNFAFVKNFEARDVTNTNSLATAQACAHSTAEHRLSQVQQRICFEDIQPMLFSDILPKRTKLRTKRTVRCRKDLEAGKMNILIQPKQFPLEGDSSMKVQKGKWYVKDGSAVHEVPFISITKLPDMQALLDCRYDPLEVTLINPREVDVMYSFSVPKRAKDVVEAVLNTKEFLFDARFGRIEETQAEPIHSKKIHAYPVYCAPLRVASNIIDFTAALDLQIGAYEDELLRDGDDNEEKRVVRGSSDSGNETLPNWSFELCDNVAIVRIPVKLDNDTAKLLKYAKESSSVKVLELNVSSQIRFASDAKVSAELLLQQAPVDNPIKFLLPIDEQTVRR